MKSIKNKALKKTVVAVDKIKEYNDKIAELNKLKSEIYINKGMALINLLELQVEESLKKCTRPRHCLYLLTIQQMILFIKVETRLLPDPSSLDTSRFAHILKRLIEMFNDVKKVPTDFMSQYKEIHTIYTCMVNLEFEFRKE